MINFNRFKSKLQTSFQNIQNLLFSLSKELLLLLLTLKANFLTKVKEFMIPDHMKLSDARVQSFGIKFNFITKVDKLIIQATCSKDKQQYIGEILTSPYVDFQDIKQLLQQCNFKTLLKTQQILKIKIGAIPLDLFSKSESQIKNLKATIQKSIQKQYELQQIILNQKDKIDEHEILIYDLKNAIQQLKSSPKISLDVLEGIKYDLNEKITELSDKMINFDSLIINNVLKDNVEQLKQNQKLIQPFQEELTLKNQSELNDNKIKIITNQLNYIKSQFKKLKDALTKQLSNNKTAHEIITTQINQHLTITNNKFKLVQNILQIHQKKQKQFANIQAKILTIQSLILDKDDLIQEMQENNQIQNEIQQFLYQYQYQNQQKQVSSLFQKFKWSSLLKHNKMIINNNFISTKDKSQHFQFSLLEIGFDRKFNQKITWDIKINKNSGGFIYLGICSKNIMLKNDFHDKNINWKEKGHGSYLIYSSGKSYLHSLKEFNNVDNGFPFYNGDVINIEYDPIRLCLTFKNKMSALKYEMPIILPLINDYYHPCVGMSLKTILSVEARVQLIPPVQKF